MSYSYYKELVKQIREEQDEERAYNDALWERTKAFIHEIAQNRSSEKESVEAQVECVERF